MDCARAAPRKSDDIETVIGIGKRLAQQLRTRGITTRGELLPIIDELPIATKMDLTYKPCRKIPRKYIKNIDQVLKKIFRKHGCRYIIAGSYRREKSFSKDIDILVDSSCLEDAPLTSITNMINKSRVRTPVKLKLIEPYSSGSDRISALFAVNLDPNEINKSSRVSPIYYKVDFFMTPPKEWVPALVYATGSQQFNIRMRAVAKHRGWKLNQRGLFKPDGSTIPVKTERELFKVLDITYRDPPDRTV